MSSADHLGIAEPRIDVFGRRARLVHQAHHRTADEEQLGAFAARGKATVQPFQRVSDRIAIQPDHWPRQSMPKLRVLPAGEGVVAARRRYPAGLAEVVWKTVGAILVIACVKRGITGNWANTRFALRQTTRNGAVETSSGAPRPVVPATRTSRRHDENVGGDFAFESDVCAPDLDDEGRESLMHAHLGPGDDAEGAQAVEAPV